jgi:AcrR family transcriptional regulator
VPKAGAAHALGPESRDPDARKQVLVDAAIELFAEVGYDGASTRMVAERAGCSETLLFRYFGGKRGLLLAICNRMTERHVERLRAEDFADVETYLEHHVLNVLAQMRRDGPSIRVIVGAIVTDGELAAEFEQRHDEEVEFVTAQLDHFRRAGTIAPHVDLRSIAKAVEQASFALGLLLQGVYGKPQSELKAVARAMATTLGAGMRSSVR